MSNKREERAARAEQMRKDREKAARRQRNVISIAIVAIVAILIVLAYLAYQSAAPNYQSKVVAPKHTTDEFGIVYNAEAEGGTTKPNAVTVELYEDFQCPVCRSFEQSFGLYLATKVKAGEVVVVYHPFPILDHQSLNDYATRSANVAMAVLDQGGVAKYHEFHQYLYGSQPEEGTEGPVDKELIAAAKALKVTGISTLVKDRQFVPWLEKAVDKGSKRISAANLKATGQESVGTPSVFVNGEFLKDFGQLMTTIEEASKG